MKIAVIGGAGVRTPLLVHGLSCSDLPITEVALFDIDDERLRVVAGLAQRRADHVPVHTYRSVREAISGAAYVFLSIRVGGIEARARDEAIALEHGVVGQETVGPGGFSMALRTIPHVVAYAREVRQHAPHAWIINFTNPVGIITQAVLAATGARIIGICDTPTELFEEIAHAIGRPSAECYFDYFGLNHLGWVREVYWHGEPQLARLWGNPAALARLYRVPLFSGEFLDRLRLLPTEYVYYYYRSREAFENVRDAGKSRGQVIEQLNARLFNELAHAADPVGAYEEYLAARNAGYMQIESGAAAPPARSPWAELTGYDKIALAVVRAIHFNSNAIIPLNVQNNGNLPELEAGDTVELPCVVNANGARALHAGRVPECVRDLLVQVKAYERLTVQAGLSRDATLARQALAANPLVNQPALAARLLEALQPL